MLQILISSYYFTLNFITEFVSICDLTVLASRAALQMFVVKKSEAGYQLIEIEICEN